ncbi:MAG: family 20 glycosylhydrolase [Bacteroidota bacterium]
MKYHFLSFIALVLFFSCQQAEQTPQIAVEWEHITNFTGEPGVFESKFTLTHESGKPLNDHNWIMYFNIAPRPMVPTPTTQPAVVEHINGDWYKMTPSENFTLEEGESIEILYRGTEATIKETDRPLGLYFVYYDDAGNEEEIVEVVNYSYKHFTKPEQIHRSDEDYDPIPTPAYLYQTNQKLSKLPENDLDLIVPSPVSLTKLEGNLTIDNSYTIYYDDGLESEGHFLKEKLGADLGLDLQFSNTKQGTKSILLQLGNININGVDSEAYELTIDTDKITITGADPAGVFYGIQSLRALIPVSSLKSNEGSIELANVKIKDAPRFGFRSLHLDIGRNFQTKETIFKLLDVAAFYKVNHFLFYVTEDEGWRLEIPGLPELTEVGAVRKHTSSYKNSVLHPAYGSGPFASNSDEQHGTGFISRHDFIELLKYAHQRHITIIPEVNFPGHARAAIKSMEARYERLMELGKPEEAEQYRLIDPEDQSKYISAQAYQDNVVCVVRKSAYDFYEKVVDEIIAMYKEAGVPINKFHMGGDEVPNGAWTGSAMIAEFMKEHPEIENHHQLHAYFIKRMTERLKDKGLEWHGWEEVALKKLPDGNYVPNEDLLGKNIVPYIWNNLFDYPDIGYKLANAGYPIVLCNVSNFYFDLAYSKDPSEPGLYWAGFINTRDNWNFAPFNMYTSTETTSMGSKLHVLRTENRGDKTVDIIKIEPGNYPLMELERLKPDAYKNIIGVEAQIWSETIKGEGMLEYYYLPKLIGFAESAWSKMRPWENIDDEAKRDAAKDVDWNRFANKLAITELPRLSYVNEGYNYRVPPPGGILEDGTFKANVEYPGLKIYYNLDGSEPTIESQVYTEPVIVEKETIVKLKAIDSAGKTSKTVTATIAEKRSDEAL